MTRILTCCRLALFVALAFHALAPRLQAEDRPSAPKLLPENTVLYVRVADSKALVERFKETSMGRIGQDDKIRPLVAQLYGSAAEAFAQIEDEVGLPLDKILALPQGEMCFAMTSPPSGSPAMLAIFHAGDQMPAVQKLLDRGDEIALREGATKTTETIGDVKLTIYKVGSNDSDQVAYFEKDGCLVLGSNLEELKRMLAAWEGTLKEDDKTLADNKKFTSIMNRCQNTKDDPPQITWFVDPILLAKTAGRGNLGAQLALGSLPALGLDGLQGVGGSITLATGEFDSVAHVHVLIDEPRSGVLEAIAVTSGDVTPEPWVPVDAATYMTINFDVGRSFASISKLYNSFRGDNALAGDIQRRINDRLEVDFEKDLLGACAGRFTYFQWMEKPARLDSGALLLGVQLKDPKAFQEVFDKLTTKYADNLEKTAYGTTPYWRIKVAEGQAAVDEERAERRRERREQLGVREPQPCFAIVGDYVLITDRPSILEQAIATSSEKSKQLANDLEFKLILSKIKRQPGGESPGMITYSRPEESMKMLYELAQAEDTKKLLEANTENNRFLQGVDKALKDNPLPPFAVISKYLAPGGGFLVSDETGFHYAAFQLRRK